LEQIYNSNEDSLNKKDDEARLIIQLKTKRCTTSKNVFGDLEPLTEESFVSEDDPSTNKITISSIEDIPTIGCSSSNPDQTSSQQPPPSRQQYNKKDLRMEQENKSSKKPVSFEFIGPSRAIQKKIQIGKKGAAVAAQEFPPTFDLEKLKEYRKKTGPAPKLFMPTDQDKEEAEKEASQFSQEQSRAEINSENHDENGNASTVILENSNIETEDQLKPEDMDLDEEFQQASQNQNSTAWNNSRQKSRSRSRSRTRSYSRSRSRSCSYSSSSRSRSRGSSYCSFSNKRQRSRSRSRGRSRSGTPDIPIRRGSPSFLEKRRITSARKRPIPYRRKRFRYDSPSSESSYSSYSRSSRSYSRSSRSRSRSSSYERNLRVPWSRSRSRSPVHTP